jgi:hypothetical protein
VARNRDGVSARALEAAMLEASEDAKRPMLAGDDMLTLSAASAQKGCSTHELSRRRRRNLVLALSLAGGKGGSHRFPAFQFEPRVCEVMPELLALFGPGRAWQLYDFLRHPEPLLQGCIPLDLLRCGRAAEVLHVAKNAARLQQGAY